jgi:L-serine dehydratase
MKKVNSIFDVIGPIMVGPSSSHTAGAAKLARIARSLSGEEIKKVIFMLHGSFQTTYKGHGTDRALLAGILGLAPSDPSLVDAYELAEKAGLEYEFVKKDLGPVHPNTIKFIVTGASGNVTELVGASVGGGEVLVSSLNGFEVSFSGNSYTVISIQDDVPGIVSEISGVFAAAGLNLATITLSRSARGREATMIMEIDSEPSQEVLDRLRNLPRIRKIICYRPVEA